MTVAYEDLIDKPDWLDHELNTYAHLGFGLPLDGASSTGEITVRLSNVDHGVVQDLLIERALKLIPLVDVPPEERQGQYTAECAYVLANTMTALAAVRPGDRIVAREAYRRMCQAFGYIEADRFAVDFGIAYHEVEDIRDESVSHQEAFNAEHRLDEPA